MWYDVIDVYQLYGMTAGGKNFVRGYKSQY